MNAALGVRDDDEHVLQVQAIQDEGSERVTLQRSSSTTCQSLCEDNFTFEEEWLRFIVQGPELEFPLERMGGEAYKTKQLLLTSDLERSIWGAENYTITLFLNFQEGLG